MAATQVMQPIVLTSAASALMQLDESEPLLQSHALRALNNLVDAFWPEISPYISKIQALSENDTFTDHELASLVAAKVLFHLGDIDQALEYALAANSLFSVSENTEFSRTLRAKCIDEYVAAKSFQAEADMAASNAIDIEQIADTPKDADMLVERHVLHPGLEVVVEKILDDCVKKGEVNEALGIAIEARRPDRVKLAIEEGSKNSKDKATHLAYCFECAQFLVSSRSYRNTILSLIADLHRKEAEPDEVAIAHCLIFIEDAEGVANSLARLIIQDAPKRELTALQIAFDIYDNDTPVFAQKIANTLAKIQQDQAQDMSPEKKDQVAKKMDKLKKVLSGNITSTLLLDFLFTQNHADMYILKKMKSSLDSRNSVCHSGLVFSNAIAHAGTTIDTFLRENLEWLARATSWAKFSATACLGVIHARNTSNALNLLSPYLSSQGSSGSAFSEGGALYALGLIAATGPSNATSNSLSESSGPPTSGTQLMAKEYLMNALANASSNETIEHGGCLGLGLSCMASWDGSDEENEVYDQLKSVLYTDSAVAGEAAAIGMGLVCLGSGSSKIIEEMHAYAQETQHEKISRGLAMAIALVLYGCEDEAYGTIKTLANNSNPLIRYGGMYALGLAYCGTANNRAIRLLLHMAVSDVNDDVRRAAVTNIGFVLFRHPKQIPKIISLLSESCHAHVRYGAAMAIGIACAGSGLSSAVDILEHLLSDSSDFVRQGALIGLSMVLMQQTEARHPKVKEVRKTFEKTVGDRHEDVMTRFGAVLASGIIDAGGRNCMISMMSHSGHRRMSAVVGLAMFTQFWYWFPYIHFLVLALKPQGLIALNSDLKMPVLEVKSNAKPSLFGYPAMGPPVKVKEKTKAPVAILSVTAKLKAREAKKEKSKAAESSGGDAMETDKAGPSDKYKATDEKAKEERIDVDKEEDAEDKPVVEESFTMLQNPSRVLPEQEKSIVWITDGRYHPLKRGISSGFIMLQDNKKGEPEEIIELKVSTNRESATNVSNSTEGETPSTENTEDEGPEPEPPQPFEYVE